MTDARSLIRVLVEKEIALLRRYIVNTISEFLLLYAFFAIIFFGGSVAAPEFIGESLPDVIVGFMLWTMALVAYQGLSWDLINEAQWGTLEQLYMSPFGFGRIVRYQLLLNVAQSFVFGAGMLALMMVTTGRYLSIPVGSVLVVGGLAMAMPIAIGFVLGGLALIYKRIESLFQIVQVALIAFIAAPTEPWPLALLPLTLGSSLLRRAMKAGLSVWELPAADLALFALKAAVYLAVGYYVFLRAEREARDRGVLGHY